MKYYRPKIIVSQCIEHGHCRFDGSMITSSVVHELAPFVEFMPLCPEMAIGLPCPRESLRLVKKGEEISLLQNISGKDMTDAMLSYCGKVYEEIKDFMPEGFILKGRSPSCGIKDVKLYASLGKAPCVNKSSKGIFGEAMMEYFPESLFEDEGRMTNFSIREHFFCYIFTMAEFQEIRLKPTMGKLVEFQSKNKYLFMAYSQNISKVLGRLVANHNKEKLEEIVELYYQNLVKLFAKKPSKGQYINIMMHIFGYFSKQLNAKEKAYFLDALEDYRESHIPQSIVLSMLYAWVLRFEDEYLSVQTVFHPFPKELIQVTDSGKVV